MVRFEDYSPEQKLALHQLCNLASDLQTKTTLAMASKQQLWGHTIECHLTTLGFDTSPPWADDSQPCLTGLAL